MAWKKQEDAYFADTFDRDALMCSIDCAIDANKAVPKSISIDSSGLSFTMPNVRCYDTLNEVTGYVATTADNTGNWTLSSCDTAGVSIVDTVSDKLQDLQAQINVLKKNLEKPKVTDGLRSALKTLQYKREVE